MGAAIERSPSSSSWSTSAQPWRGRVELGRSACGRAARCAARLARGRRRAPSAAGEQHAAHRGRVGGEARADVDRHAHDPRDRHAARRRRCRSPSSTDTEEDSCTSATRRSRCGSAISGSVEARQVGVAEVEHARREGELRAVAAHVAEVGEREQEAPRGGAGQPGRARDVATACSSGCSASNARITARPRSSDCTKCGPRGLSRAGLPRAARRSAMRDGGVGRRARPRRPPCGSAPRGSPPA